MIRFMGLMPKNEIKMSKIFVEPLGLKIRIDAGENGWTIVYADSSCDYKDEVDTTENNFDKALSILKTHFEVTEYKINKN